MPIVRFILLALAVAAIVMLVRRLLNDRPRAPRRPEQLEEDVVRCAQCGLHVPRSEALTFKDKHFCSDSHKQEFLRD